MRTRNALLSAITLLWIFALPEEVNCKRILIISSLPLYSHQSVFRPLWLALHKRGHELVVTEPLSNVTLNNYTKIDFSFLKVIFNDGQHTNQLICMPKWEIEKTMIDMLNIISKKTFEHPQMRKLYAPESNEKFDLVVVDAMLGPSLHSFAHRFHAPLIGITSMEPNAYIRYLLGDLLLSSYPSHWEFDRNADFNLPFWQRMTNYLEMLAYIYRWTYIYMPQQQEIVRKYLGADAGDFYDTIRNMSLLLIGRPTTFMYAKPDISNIIYFNGLHITKKPPPLPKYLKKFLDDATEGFVYMSLGTTINSSNLPKEKLSAIIKALSKLPYKVLWKFEKENLPGKPENVFIMKWTPQQGVLAHPNIKVFICQGGEQSTEEAIYYAVPLVGLPILFDQRHVINRLVERGVARRVDFCNLSDADLTFAIREVFDNKRYKENMISLSELTKDKPVDDLENLVWWIEYVMRHNGAPHLRYNGANQSFYERHDTSIIAFFAIAVFIIIMLLLLILTKCLYFIVWSHMLVDTIYKTSSRHVNMKEKTS